MKPPFAGRCSRIPENGQIYKTPLRTSRTHRRANSIAAARPNPETRKSARYEYPQTGGKKRISTPPATEPRKTNKLLVTLK
jgi:hypothetical protein